MRAYQSGGSTGPCRSGERHRTTASGALALCLACLSAAPLTGAPPAAKPPAAADTDPAKTAPAKATVAAFLEAVKRGDDPAARGLLTKVARAKTEELGISVAPPVTDTAIYSVQGCQIVSDDGDLAHVATVWTDVAPDGTKSSENIVWVVRLDPEGWRVVGMAMRVFDDMPPLLLDFEDPEDMIAKQEMVAAELEKQARREAEAAASGQRTARGDGRVPGARQ